MCLSSCRYNTPPVLPSSVCRAKYHRRYRKHIVHRHRRTLKSRAKQRWSLRDRRHSHANIVKSCALPFAVSALSFFFSFSYDNSFVFACIIAYYCNTLHTPSRRVTHIYIRTYTSFSAFFSFLFLSSFFFLPHTVPLHLFGFDF